MPASDELPFPPGTYKGIHAHGDASFASEEWAKTHVQRNHGPLGALYPRANPYFKEGDTPSFLHLIPNGLSDPEQPGWGSWGGRFQGAAPMFTDLVNTPLDQTTPSHPDFRKTAMMTVARWRGNGRAAAGHVGDLYVPPRWSGWYSGWCAGGCSDGRSFYGSDLASQWSGWSPSDSTFFRVLNHRRNSRNLAREGECSAAGRGAPRAGARHK